MRTTLTTILIMLTFAGLSQPLMLGFRKSDVISNMHCYPEYKQTVKALDYLEYQKSDRAYGFRFEPDSLNLYYGRWHCSEFYVTIPADQESDYFSKLECLTQIGTDRWQWVNEYDTVNVSVSRQTDFITIIYTAK